MQQSTAPLLLQRRPLSQQTDETASRLTGSSTNMRLNIRQVPVTRPVLEYEWPLLLLLLLSSSSSPLCSVFILIFLRQTMSLANSVAAVLLLLSLVSVLNLLYFYVSTFRSVCAVPNMGVYCSSFTSCFPGMLLTYFLNDFEIVPVAPIITGITFVFTFHMRCISAIRSLYFKIFSASFLITFVSREIATYINRLVPFSLSRIIMSGLLLGIVLSGCTC